MVTQTHQNSKRVGRGGAQLDPTVEEDVVLLSDLYRSRGERSHKEQIWNDVRELSAAGGLPGAVLHLFQEGKHGRGEDVGAFTAIDRTFEHGT
mmetsp:Transcript_25353/g.38526  ORF Transcript_25353/g.38526 Transcript_25353/m.38526 type:complete len:93 (+) Transcript_25353:116-394(+)